MAYVHTNDFFLRDKCAVANMGGGGGGLVVVVLAPRPFISMASSGTALFNIYLDGNRIPLVLPPPDRSLPPLPFMSVTKWQ